MLNREWGIRDVEQGMLNKELGMLNREWGIRNVEQGMGN
jgi:hypothetical protein